MIRTNKYNVAPKENRMNHGILFASKLEAEEHMIAKSEERIGNIKELELQKEFELQEKFTDANGFKHMKMSYFMDFYFYDVRQKRYRCIDTKGYATETYKLKKKLFNHKYKSQGLYIEPHI